MPIFDQGYQHWQGSLASHTWRWIAISRQGIRSQLKNRKTRYLILSAWTPAVALIAFLALWGLFEQKSDLIKPFLFLFQGLPDEVREGPRAFRTSIWTIAFHAFFWVEVGLSMFLVLLVGPDLISQDLRYNALPLYLSRPLRRRDYFLGKLGVIVGFLSTITVGPALVAYLVGVGFSLDFSVVSDTWRLLVGIILYGLLVAVICGIVMLGFSSLSKNSRVVAVIWFGLLILGNTIRANVEEMGRHGVDVNPSWQAVSFVGDLHRLRQVIFDTESARDQIARAYQDTLNAARDRMMQGGPFGPRPRLFGPPSHPPGFQSSVESSTDSDIDDLITRPFFQWLVSPYPWTVSASVLAGLCGLSLCILASRVRSLDRLR